MSPTLQVAAHEKAKLARFWVSLVPEDLTDRGSLGDLVVPCSPAVDLDGQLLKQLLCSHASPILPRFRTSWN
jgi:hypothetical protein